MANQRHTQTGGVVVYDVTEHVKVTEEQVALAESQGVLSVTQEQTTLARDAGAMHFSSEQVAVSRAEGGTHFTSEGVIVVWGITQLVISGPATYLLGSPTLPVFVGSGGQAVSLYEWSVEAGTLDQTSGVDTVEWTLPEDAAGFYTITLTDGMRTVEALIFVVGNILPHSPVEAETRKTVVFDEGDTGDRVALRKSKAFRFFVLTYNRRTKDEATVQEQLWDLTYPGDTFKWTNDDCDTVDEDFYFDSGFKSVPDGLNTISYSWVIKAKNPIVTAVPANNNLPFVPTFGYEVEEDKTLLVSDAPSLTRKATARSEKRRRFKIGFKQRPLSQFLTMEAFWNYHYPGKLINLHVDLQQDNLHLDGDFWIVSDLKWTVYGRTIDYSFEILEA